MSEGNQGNYIHVFYGHHTGKRQRGEKCYNCGDKPPQMFYTYFGGALCATCWDNYWLTTEDGQGDPPSIEITNTVSGEWINLDK